MDTAYMHCLMLLRQIVNQELDRAQLGKPPSPELYDAMTVWMPTAWQQAALRECTDLGPHEEAPIRHVAS